MTWYTAAEVTVVNGEDIVRVKSGEFVDAIRPHDGLVIGQFSAVDILTTYTEQGGAEDEIIQLVEDWPHATQTLQPAQVVPTAAHFNEGARVLTETKEKVFAQLASFFAFGNQATGTVTFSGIGIGNPDVTVRSIPQYKIDLDALELQVSGSVSDLSDIDEAVNGTGGLVEVVAANVITVANIDSTLSGYQSTTLGYRNATLGYRDQVSTWHTNVDGWQSTISGQVTTVNNAASTATTKADEADDSATLAQQHASHPHNVQIPVVGGYSALHWKEEASAIAGGNFVPETRTVNGLQLNANITLDASDIGARDDSWTPTWSDVTSKPTTFTPATHSHSISSINNLQAELDAKASKADSTRTKAIALAAL